MISRVKYTSLVLIAFLSVGGWLRIWMATSVPLWWDESFTWAGAQSTLNEMLMREHHDTHAPLAYIITSYADQFSSQSEILLRTPFIIFSLANIILSFVLGRFLIGVFGGCIFAAFIAISPALILVDYQLRMYSLWLTSILVIALVYQQMCCRYRSIFTAPFSLWASLGLGLSFAFWTHILSLCVWSAVAFAVFVEHLRESRLHSNFAKGGKWTKIF